MDEDDDSEWSPWLTRETLVFTLAILASLAMWGLSLSDRLTPTW